MKFSVEKNVLLKPLQMVSNVVEKRHTLPILANVLVNLDGQRLSMTGTDHEVEISSESQVDGGGSSGDITIPAKKFLDIIRSLPEGSSVSLKTEENCAIITSGQSRFQLSTLSANEFPNIEPREDDFRLSIPQAQLKRLIDKTAFAMAQQDVRYYLNGMLWEVHADALRTVATDGHRLAMSTAAIDGSAVNGLAEGSKQCILPRKGVQELQRLLSDVDDACEIVVSSNHLRVVLGSVVFTTKLIEGKFPDYERVLPKNGDKIAVGDRLQLKQAFNRTSILSNEKYRGVRLVFDQDQLTISANNPEREEAHDVVPVSYSDERLEVGFNVTYLLDVANVLDGEEMSFTLIDGNSSALIKDTANSDCSYVVMPMRL